MTKKGDQFFERLKKIFRGVVNIPCPRAPTPLVTPLILSSAYDNWKTTIHAWFEN